MKPKTVDKWNLSDGAKDVIKRELQKWLDMLIEQADGKTGNVIRADFIKDDFYFYTDCRDIMKNDPEWKSDETNNKVRSRKIKVLHQLLLRQIMGQKLGRKLTCTHCGNEETITKCENGNFKYCPHCKKIRLIGYLPTFDKTVESMLKLLEAKK